MSTKLWILVIFVVFLAYAAAAYLDMPEDPTYHLHTKECAIYGCPYGEGN